MTTPVPRKRGPRGVRSDRPIALRLMPNELDQAEVVSSSLGLSKATFARKAYLAGIQVVVESDKNPNGDHHA